MAGTMGRMYIGASGLQASQNAINTTAHNLTNLSTEGYSRQQVIQSDLAYQKLGYTKVSIKQTGLGTKVSETRTTRDIFLDNKYRTQNARKDFYNTKAGIIDEVSEFFGETEGNTFETYMKICGMRFRSFKRHRMDIPSGQHWYPPHPHLLTGRRRFIISWWIIRRI